MNHRAAQVLGRAAEDLIGKNIWTEFPQGIGGPFYTAYAEAVQRQTPIQLEEYSAALSRWFENRIYPGPDGLSIFFQDISERKIAEQERLKTEAALRESEHRLKLAMESGKLGAFHLDLTRREFLSVSDVYKAHFGYDTDSPLSYSAFWQAIHTDDVERVRAATQAAIDDHTDYEVEGRSIWPDGSTHWILAHGSAVYDAAGLPISLIGVTQDITERKHLEQEQARALREAQAQADHDSLTGLLNHRAFHIRLQEEAARSRREDTTLAVVVLDLDNFQYFNDVYGHATGDHVIEHVASRLRTICRPYDCVARFGGDEFSLLMCNVGYSTVREIEARILKDLEGIVYQAEGQQHAVPITLSVGAALYDTLSSDRHETLRVARERLRWLKSGGEPDVEAESVRNAAIKSVDGFSMLDALVAAVDNKDRYTRRHSEDVMTYSLMIARELGLDEAMQETIAVAALLHDVGKIGVPDAILRKPSSLTEEEYAAVRRHPEMGAVIVSAVPGLEAVLDAVRHHHECWNGTGYPAGLRGEETPLMARLMSVADAYNAMTTNRPYRRAMDHTKALAILDEGAGTQWDPTCVFAFRTAVEREMAPGDGSA